jgi:hypothetical protein
MIPPMVKPTFEKIVHDIKLPFSGLLSFNMFAVRIAGINVMFVITRNASGTRPKRPLLNSIDQKELRITTGAKNTIKCFERDLLSAERFPSHLFKP